MSESIPVYTSTPEGGIVHKPIVEPAISTTVRMNDPQYGLSTGARRVHDRVEQQAARDEWKRQKAEAIAKQRARENEKRVARLREINAEIMRLKAAWESDACSDKAKVEARLIALLDKHDALMAKIEESK